MKGVVMITTIVQSGVPPATPALRDINSVARADMAAQMDPGQERGRLRNPTLWTRPAHAGATARSATTAAIANRPDQRTIASLAQEPRVMELQRGDVLYRDGDVADGLYLVVQGALKVLVASISDRPRLADIVGAGDVIGVATLEQARHAETVVAASASLVVPVAAFDDLSREQRAAVAASLARQFGRSRAYADDIGLPTGARISRVLTRLAARFGGEAALPDVHLPFSLTHDDLALLAGCARVTATRILGELKVAGAVRGNRGDYSVTPERLEEETDRYVFEYL